MDGNGVYSWTVTLTNDENIAGKSGGEWIRAFFPHPLFLSLQSETTTPKLAAFSSLSVRVVLEEGGFSQKAKPATRSSGCLKKRRICESGVCVSVMLFMMSGFRVEVHICVHVSACVLVLQ